MIKSIVREHHWKPKIINNLFIDDLDFKGLEFWYNDVLKIQEELKTKPTK